MYVRIILETLLQLFNNFQCHTQINLRYRQCSQCRPIIFNILRYPKIVDSNLDLNESTESTSTTVLGKLFQILTIPLVNENIS